MKCKVLLQIQAQMIDMKPDTPLFFPAYTEAKEEEEVLFCLLSVEQTACCAVGEEAGVSPAPLLVPVT